MGDRFTDSSQQQLDESNENNKKKKTVATSVKQSSMEDFEITTKLGDGAYSSVYKVKRIADAEIYALKKVKLHHLSEKEKENAINEVRILASIKHNNIISYKESFIEPQTQSLCIVMEYADDGDLFQKICDHQKNKTYFQENEIWKVFIQVVRGLKAMHDLNIMHRDLKSANVFLCKDYTAKLGDMNVSKVANKRGLNYTQTGTPYYASPEVWRDEPYDIKSDIWSLGCVLYEMIALKPPFTADDMQGLFKKVTRGQYPRIPKNFSHDLWTMVKYLLQVNPQSRPNCDQIMNIPTFAKKFEKMFPEEHAENEQNILLKTIKFPKNLMYLSDRLPKQNYTNYHNTSGGEDSIKKNYGSKTYQHKDNIKLPTIQNVKQVHMNSVNLGNPANYISGNDDEPNNNSLILASSPYRKKQTGRSLQKPKREEKLNTQNQSILGLGSDEPHSKSPAIDDTNIEINSQLNNNQLSRKKHSLQHYTSLEVLNEEGISKLTNNGGNESTGGGDNSTNLVLVASEKRLNKNEGGMVLPLIGGGAGSNEAVEMSVLKGGASLIGTQDPRHVSPLLIKTKNGKKMKVSQHVVSISQDYGQKKILSNQNSSITNNNVQKALGGYQMNPTRIMHNYQKATISPPEKSMLAQSESQERLRASPQRIQDILNRYNLKQLKSNLKYGMIRGPKNNRQIQYGKYYINQSYANNKDTNQPLLNNNSSVDLIVGTHIERNQKMKEKHNTRIINEQDMGGDDGLGAAQSTINTMKINMAKIQQAQNAYSVNNSSLILPKLDNSLTYKHQQQIEQLSQAYKGSQQQSPRNMEKRTQKNRLISKNKSNFEGSQE